MLYLETNRFSSPSQKKEFGSAAFNLEYRQNISSASLREDIVSYLGEYRFKLQKYNYELLFGFGEDGLKLRDVNDNEAMTTKAQRAIERRFIKNPNTSREQAELEGLLFLEKQLLTAKDKDQLIWVSPPGPKEDGYGDYGFVYFGVVKDGKIKMSAIRIEQPTLTQFNQLIRDVTREEIQFKKAEDFLAHPFILASQSVNIELVLGEIFNFQLNEAQFKMFNDSIKRVSPYIEKFINMVKQGCPKDELLRIFHSIENYAIDLINNPSLGIKSNSFAGHFQISIPIDQFVRQYGYKPPTAVGSCGDTKESESPLTESNRLFSSNSILKQIFEGDKSKESYFTCPSCHIRLKPPVGNCCPKDRGGCGLTKEEAQKKGFKTC